MVRSLANRKMPKPFAVLLSVLLAIIFLPTVDPGAANALDSFQYTLQGCRLAAGETLPNADGKFICAEADYTTGNLGKSWNELDLVPHRVTVTGSGSTSFVIAADYMDAGKPGYDVLSAPVINDAKSTAGCTVTSGPQSLLTPGQGGADTTVYRTVTVTAPANGGTCVFDYYQRLALGSHLYPGSSLHSNLLSTNFDTGGIGSKEVSIPVKEILPQKLEKTMTATQGSTYAWTVKKTATPLALDFTDTCAQSTQPKSQAVSIKIDWTRSAVQPDGDVTLTTQITATNPAHREITVNVTDKMYSGTTQTDLLATNSDTFDLPAESSHTFTFTKTVSSTASSFNDVATATYTDKATGISVPGNTTATASASVTSNGQTSGATAVITDVESITGTGFSYSVDSVTPSQGSFGAYAPGTQTTSNVTWNSGTIAPAGTGAASGSFTFAKTVYVAAGTVGSGNLADTATLTPQGRQAISDNASVSLTADAANPQLRFTKTVDIAPDADATFTFDVWVKDANGNKVGSPYTFTVTIPAGQTSATSAPQTVLPSQYGYLYEETAASGYTGVNGTIKALTKCEDYTQQVNNTRDLGKLMLHKVMQGDPVGTSTSFTVHVDCPGTTYDQNVVLNQANSWTNLTGDIPTGTVCTLTEPTVPTGWRFVSIQPSVVTVGKGTPTGASATITNQRRVGTITINKKLVGDVAGASTDFTVLLDCDGTAYDQTVLLGAANNWTVTYSNIPTLIQCEVTEPTAGIPAGWALQSISPAGKFSVESGTTTTVDVTNQRLTGQVTINKALNGPVAGASTDFVAHIDCDINAYDADVPLNAGNGYTATLTIPTGVKCAVTETSIPAGWALQSIDPSGQFTIGTTKVTVAITNTRLTGQVTINKVLDGPVAGASTDFVAHLDCDVNDYDQDVALGAANGWTATVTIPAGVKCTVTEKSIPAGWTLESIDPSGQFTVGATKVTVTITNRRVVTGVTIKKVLDGPVAGASTDFTAHLDCDGTGYDQDVVLSSGNSWQQTVSVPSGVTCAVTEKSIPAGWTLESITPAGSFVVGSQTVEVTITNSRDTGQVTINKVLDGPVAGASTDFVAHLDCDVNAYDQDVTLGAANGWTTTVTIPTGVKCAVTETSIPTGWTLESIDPSGQFTVGATKVTVNITNKRSTGQVTINKVLDGPVAGASTTFVAHLDCDVNAYDQDVTLSAANGWTTTVTIPTGVKCAVTETSIPAGWTLESIDPSGQFTVGATKVTVNITNKRSTGQVTITKVLQGPVAGADTDFTVHLDCDVNAYDQDVILNSANNWTLTLAIPTGVKCTVTETDIPAGWSLSSITPGSFTAGQGDGAVNVTVTNTRDTGLVDIKKVLDGPIAGAGTDFTVHVDCDVNAYDQDVTLTSGNNWSSTLSLPSLVSCKVTEKSIPAGWSLESIQPSSFTVSSTTAVTVTVTNARDTGTVTIKKVLSGDVAGASTSFTAHLDCDVNDYDQDVALSSANGWSATLTIPAGVKCTVTETSIPAGWTLESIDPSGEFAVGAGQDVAVTITNQRALGVITVAKELVGSAATLNTDFVFDVDCPGSAYDQTVNVSVTDGAKATGTTKPIPTGLTCTVTERDHPHWSLTKVVPSDGAVAVGGTVTFTNERKPANLTITKAVSPVAGHGVVVNFGDTLTYTLTVTASGQLDQPSVKVTDYVPGFDPARPASGRTTYVKGSATCVGAGDCTVTEPGADGLITWQLGDMAGGTSRQVTFKVTIDRPAAATDGSIPAVDILNAGAVESTRTPRTPSNEVVTPVAAVLGVKIPAAPLPRTGAAVPIGPLAGSGLFLVGLGLLLLGATRRRGEQRRG